MTGWKEGFYSEGYRMGMYLAVYHNGTFDLLPRNTYLPDLYMIAMQNKLCFIKHGTGVETLYAIIQSKFKHPNCIVLTAEQLEKYEMIRIQKIAEQRKAGNG